jgi:DNA polymerase-1
MATLAEDEYLRGVFNEGRDIHSEVAERFFGSGFTKEQRVRAKAVVFGLAYGREAFSLAAEFGIPVAEAQRYLNQFFEVIPDLVAWRNDVQDRVTSSHEDLVSPFGRHRRFWLITNDNKKDILKEALAFLPQSTASDICLSALIALGQSLPSEARLRLPVHDSILVECPESMAADVGQFVKQTMEHTAKEVFTDYVNFDVDVAIGNSWGEL